MPKRNLSSKESGNAGLQLLLLLAALSLGLLVLLFPNWMLVPAVILVPSSLLFLKRPFAGLIIITITLPLMSRTTFSNFGDSIPDLDYSKVVILGLAGLIALRMIATRTLPKLIAFDAVVGAYVTMGVISLFRGEDLWENGREYVQVEMLPVLLYVLARATLTNRERFEKWLLALGAAGAATSVLLLAEFVLKKHFFFPDFSRDDFFRSQATWPQPNGAACYTSLSIIALVFLFLRGRHIQQRILMSSLLLLCCGGIIVTFSRRGWGAALIGVCILLLGQNRKRYLVALAGAGAVALLFAIPDLHTSSLLNDRILAQNTVKTRLFFVQTSIRMWSDSPIIGLGYNAPRHRYDEYDIPANIWHAKEEERGWRTGGWSPHNSFLTALIEGGIIRFLLLGLVFFFLIPKLIRASRWKESDIKDGSYLADYMLLYLGISAGLVASSFAGDTLRDLFTLGTFLCFAASTANGVQAEGLAPVILATEGPKDSTSKLPRPAPLAPGLPARTQQKHPVPANK